MQYLKKKMAAANKQLLTAKSTQRKSGDSTHCMLSKHCIGNDFVLQIR